MERRRNGPKGRGTIPGKGAVALFLFLALLVALPGQALAHPPKEVSLTYDASGKTITVRISHGVQSPGSHYINKVELKRDGKVINVAEYKNQPDQATFSYVYPVDASGGGSFEAKVTCNIFGSKTEKLTVDK